MKFKKLFAALLVVLMLVSLAGCNYVKRPFGTANHGEDLSGLLSDLLIIPQYVLEEPEHTTEEVKGDPTYVTVPGKDDEEEPNDEPTDDPVEPDPVYTPFTSTYDVNELLSKIDELVATMKLNNGVANSSTGVSDELLNGRSVKILVPDDFMLDENSEAVKAISEQYGCAVNIRRVGTGSAYTAACRRAVLAGDNVDLIYVDNGVWGDVQFFTQRINSFVNFDLADELDTFSSVWSKKFYVADDLETTLHNYYVAAGMGAPYLLAYNKDNLATATLKEEVIKGDYEDTVLREIEIEDPVKMYDDRTWGIGALNALLSASTKDTNVGIASKLDDLNGLDIWYGMSDFAGFGIQSTSGYAAFWDTATADRTVDMVQNWYWTNKGVDSKNYVGSFAKANAWENGNVFMKLFNAYSGSDSDKSYSFVGIGPEDLATLKAVAKRTGGSYDFVAYPYADHHEDTYRSYTEEEFEAVLQEDAEMMGSYDYVQQVVTPVAGWAGGFAVTANCQSPSVALRVAEELTKIWKDDVEAGYYAEMTEEQQARYDDMKNNMGLSFVRAWVEKAADVNEVYPGISKYFPATDTGYSGNLLTPGRDPDSYSAGYDRPQFQGLKFFDDNAALAVHAMYHKNDANGLYNPEIHRSWSGWMSGSVNVNSNNAKDTGKIARILNASLLPGTILFE